jgi:hypothetical protein
MVKKIQIVEHEEATATEMDTADFQQQLIELLTAIDWKLWEIYKIQQEHNQRKSPAAEEKNATKKSTTPRTKSTVSNRDAAFSSIRLDED